MKYLFTKQICKVKKNYDLLVPSIYEVKHRCVAGYLIWYLKILKDWCIFVSVPNNASQHPVSILIS